MEGRTRMILLGAAAVVLIGGFVFLVNRADDIVPARQEVRVALPDAFKD